MDEPPAKVVHKSTTTSDEAPLENTSHDRATWLFGVEQSMFTANKR